MKKKPIDITVQFGNLNIGDVSARLGLKVNREALTLEEADQLFAGHRLEGRITLESKTDESQKRLPGTEDARPEQLEASFDVRRFAADTKHFTTGLTMNLDEVDVRVLSGFSRRPGRLLVKSSEELVVSEEDDGESVEDGELDVAEAERPRRGPRRGGGRRRGDRQKSEPLDP